MNVLHRVRGAATAGAGMLVATVAHTADDQPTTKAGCFEAHEQGQLSRNSGRLRAARASFLQCSDEICPSLVRKDCLAWVEQVTAVQPTVIVAATDPNGRDTGDVRVFDGDEVIANRLTGAPIPLDPGEHHLRFEATGQASIERSVLVREGEKDRMLTVRFVAAPSSAPDAVRAPVAVAGRRSIEPFTLALGGASLAAFGVFSYFAVAGKSREHDLASSCSPRCSPDAIASVKRDYLIADVALGVGLVTAGIAAWSLVSRPSVRAAEHANWVDFKVTNGGANLVLRRDF